MAKTAKKKSKDETSDNVQMELIYSDDTQFKYWRSNLFNDVFLRKDLPQNNVDMWEVEDSGEFQSFLSTLRDLASEYGDHEKSLKKWSETETINNWIKFVLDGLGWSKNCSGVQNPYLEETSFTVNGKTYRTDILIVDLPKEKKYIREKSGSDRLVEARESVLMPVEAKYWKRLEQYRQDIKEELKRNDQKSDDISRSSPPNEQIVKYMNLLKKDWGILTDGATWRLFNRELSGEDAERYYEFNLHSLIESILTEETEQDRNEVIESAKYFYFFFCKNSHFPEVEGEESFVDEVLRYSKRYVNRVEEDLKQRFVKAINIACNGFNQSDYNASEGATLDMIRSVSESALFNILFTKSLESRNVLPMSAVDYKKISLSNIIDKIERFDPEKDDDVNERNLSRSFSKGNGNKFQYKNDGTELHEKIVRLTRIIHDGNSKRDDFGFEIKGFRESVFSDKEWKFFKDCTLDNYTWTRILFELGYADSDIKSRKYQQIPYSYFTPRQLGSIYESFLEFQIAKADVSMAFEKGQWKKADLSSQKYKARDVPKVKKGELFFTPDNKDRKATGSYYTPDYIVQYLVKESLKGLLEGKSAEEILKLQICDPAMGSGHFLVSCLNVITEAYLDKLAEESEGDLKISNSEAKRAVLDSCIYGVDINPRAVKLSKMSLWLESAHINCKLERLDDQLKIFNSLNGSWKKEFPKVFHESGISGFDSIVGNPPWGANLSQEEKDYLMDRFEHLHQRTPDTFNYFLGLSYELTKEVVGQIIPNNFLFQHEYGKSRRYLIDNFTIREVVNLGDGVFSATVPSALIIIDKQKASENSSFDVLDLRSVDPSEKSDCLNAEKKSQIRQAICRDLPDHSIPFDPLAATIVTKILKRFPNTLGDISEEVASGIGSGGDKIFRVSSELADEYNIEKEILKPLIIGRELEKNSFPKDTGYKIIYSTKATNKKQHPKTLKYLSPHEEKLSQKREAKKGLIPWWSLHWPRNPELFEKPKVIVRQTSSSLVTAVDTSGYYCLDSLLIVRVNPEYDLHFISGVMNSTFMNWFYQQITQEQGRTFAQVKPVNLRKLPFPDQVHMERNKKTVQEIATLSKRLHKKPTEIECIREIDALVCDLYGLTKEESDVFVSGEEIAA